MYINPENICKIVIRTTEKPISYPEFERFLNKSPYVRQIAFIGKAIFDSPDFANIIELCRLQSIALIFGEYGKTSIENIELMVKAANVIAVNIHEGDESIEHFLAFKEKYNLPVPEINLIYSKEPRTPQDALSDTVYGFYDLAQDPKTLSCWNLLNEPMIDYDGSLLGCWANPDKKHPINAFDLGMERALNSSNYTKILKMLKTGKPDIKCPCARCPVFLSLIWKDATLNVYTITEESSYLSD